MKKNRQKATTSSTPAKSRMPRGNTGAKDLSIFYLAATVACFTFAVFIPALQNSFVFGWDDSQYVLDNKHVHSLGWATIKWAFSDTSVALYWHPLTWLSHALDYVLWGMNPLGHHLSSVILHSLNAGIVTYLTIRLLDIVNADRMATFGTITFDRRALLITGGITGLLFGIHPLRVESVAWVAMRKDLLYALFYMLSIMSYIRYAHRNESETQRPFYRHERYYASLALFFLSLCSKPMAVTLPAVLLLLDWYPLKRIELKKNLFVILLEKLPFIVLSCIISAVSITAQNSAEGLKTFVEVTFATRLLVVFRALAMYLWKIIVPLDLLPLYPYPKEASFTQPEYVLAIAIIAAITAGCFFAAKKNRLLLAAWGFFIISVLPVVGLFQTGGQFMADRHVYLASIAPFMLLGTAISLGCSQTAAQKYGGKIKWLIAAATLSGTLLLSFATIRQLGFWKNAIVLWSYYIAKEGTRYPDVYYDRAVEFKRVGQLDRAIADYNTAISINPEFGTAYINRGVIFQEQGLFEQAIGDFKKAIILEPYSIDARINLGNTYHKMGKPDLAMAEYNTAITKKPQFPVSYINRGIVYKDTGEINKAIADFTTALSLKPDLTQIYLARGDLYMKTGVIDRAMSDYQKACEMGSEAACRRQPFPFAAPQKAK